MGAGNCSGSGFIRAMMCCKNVICDRFFVDEETDLNQFSWVYLLYYVDKTVRLCLVSLEIEESANLHLQIQRLS
ncbi:hypothetical protein C1O30_20180 [Dickeya zeae]|nr:hypothetical protein C1O30_20180 [Dickeya zeae]